MSVMSRIQSARGIGSVRVLATAVENPRGRKVCVGGTFDRLHKGHELLLTTASNFVDESGTLIVGVASDSMLKSKSLRELIQPIGERIILARQFVSTKIGAKQSLIVDELSDAYGPTITDPSIDMLVVSRETIAGAMACNDLRSKKGMPEMAIIEVDLVGLTSSAAAQNVHVNEKLSSSGLRESLLGQVLDGGNMMCRRYSETLPYVICVSGGLECGIGSIIKLLQKRSSGIASVHVLNGEDLVKQVINDIDFQLTLEKHSIIYTTEVSTLNLSKLDSKHKDKLLELLEQQLVKILPKLLSQIKAKVCLIDSTNLELFHWTRIVDEVWLASAKRKTSIDRYVTKYGETGENIEALFDSVAEGVNGGQHYHVILNTDCTEDKLESQVEMAWELLTNRLNTSLENICEPGTLPDRWLKLTKELGVSREKALHWWRLIRDRYCERHRRYHDLTHLESLFSYFDLHHGSFQKPTYVALAIFFHDVIYDPRAEKLRNEFDSAKIYRQFWMDSVILPPGHLVDGKEVVASWIERTGSHLDGPAEGDLALFLDMDLSVLGRKSGYNEYAFQVRLEYQHIDEENFAQGRASILKYFLGVKNIYFSPQFRDMDTQAKENLRREFKNLEESIERMNRAKP